MKVRVRFRKLGKVRFTSHRDIARVWERAIRRAELPMAYSQGFTPRPRVSFGLALSNALVALAGALLVQYQGFADVQMGIGMVVWGFASVIIGESLVGSRQIGLLIVGAVMGSILFRLLVAIALRWGLNANDLKLVTALFVFAALVFPDQIKRLFEKWKPSGPATAAGKAVRP